MHRPRLRPAGPAACPVVGAGITAVAEAPVVAWLAREFVNAGVSRAFVDRALGSSAQIDLFTDECI
jgi:hypothetical protein